MWHSITHNFAFLISYYGINTITTHNLNSIIFDLAARLECIGIKTIGSICDGTRKNRTHIKNFDWYISKWTSGDIVEVNFSKDKKSFHATKIIECNLEKTIFTVIPLENNNSGIFNVERTSIRPPMSPKLKWNINDMCEFKSLKDNQWYLAKIVDYDLLDLIVEIPENIEKWKIFNQCISDFLRPIYNTYELSTTHKTINPITDEDWFFISDPTHVFKKLRNNLSKSYTGKKNSREIIFNKKEVSWQHIKCVYENSNKYVTARTTKLSK